MLCTSSASVLQVIHLVVRDNMLYTNHVMIVILNRTHAKQITVDILFHTRVIVSVM